MPCPAALGRTCTSAGRYTGRHPCKPVPASTCLAVSAHTPLQNCVLPSLGAPHTCARRQAGAPGPTDRHLKTGGRAGAGGGPAAEFGQPPPRGDPASLGCGQRVSQDLARKPQGRPVPAGRVQGPKASQCQPPPRPGPRRPLISARAVHVSRAPQEARGLGLSSSSPAPRRIRHPASRALPGPRRLEIQGKSGQRRDPCPQPARRGPHSAASRSHATSAQAQLAPSRDRPVGAPWGSATRPFPTRRPQTRPKFPRPPSGRAPTCRAPGFPLLLPGTEAASSSAAEDARPGPAGPCAGSRGEHRARSHPPRCCSRRRRAPSAVPGGAGWGRSGGGAARSAGAEPGRASGSLCSPEPRGAEGLPLPALRGPGRRRYGHSVPAALREAIARRAHHTPPLDPSSIATI